MKMVSLADEIRTVGLEDAPDQRVAVSGALIAAMTTQQYKDGLYAAIRELVTNAAESHVQAGRETVPFDVSLDYPLTGETIKDEDGDRVQEDVRFATFTIRDYGLGMSPEFIEDGYYVVGHSTKREDDDVGGAFGLGAKAVFAATASILLTSYYNGTKYEYLAGMVNGFIRVKQITQPEPTVEPQGVKIVFTFKSSGEKLKSFVTLVGPKGQANPLSNADYRKYSYTIDQYNTEVARGVRPSQAQFQAFNEASEILKQCDPKCVVLDIKQNSTSQTRAFMRALLPVGHPGSTYKAIPNITINRLPMKIRDWVREPKTDLWMQARVFQREESDVMVMSAIAAYYSNEYIVLGESSLEPRFDDAGVINRYEAMRAYIKSDDDSTSQFLLWHNSYYQFKKLSDRIYEDKFDFRTAPIMSTVWKRKGGWGNTDVEPTIQIYCMPPTVQLAVTPERTGIRMNETSQRLINEYDKKSRKQLYTDMALAWWKYFHEKERDLREAVEKAVAAGDDQEAINEVHRARVQYLGVLRSLWHGMFKPTQDYLPAKVRDEFQSEDIEDFVFRRVLRHSLDKTGKYDYWFGYGDQNGIGAIKYDRTLIVSYAPVDGDQSTAEVAIEKNRRWPSVMGSRFDWHDWIVGDDVEGLKVTQRRECGDAVVVQTEDPKFVERLRKVVSELGISVIDAMGTRKPKAIRATQTFRVAMLYKNETKPTISTQRLDKLLSITGGYYAKTVGTSGILAIGESDRTIAEGSLLQDMQQYLPDEYSTAIAVIRLSDPQKTARAFEEAGLRSWEVVFQERFKELYTSWRYKTAYDKLGELHTPMTMITQLLEAATKSEDHEKWRKFLGWDKARLKRQLWYRMWTRYVDPPEKIKYRSPNLYSMSNECYSEVLFDPQLIKRVRRAYECSLYARAYDRRHGHRLPRPSDERRYSNPLVDTISHFSTYANPPKDDKTRSRQDPPEKPISKRELEFFKQFARSYVETFSQP